MKCRHEYKFLLNYSEKEFCLLRSESIRKQLNNEIVDSNAENYVYASNINLSDLGTQYNNSKGFQNRNDKNLEGFSAMPKILEVEDIFDSENKENMKDEFSMTK